MEIKLKCASDTELYNAGLRLQGVTACMRTHVHICAHLRTPLAWPKASVSVSGPAQPPGKGSRFCVPRSHFTPTTRPSSYVTEVGRAPVGLVPLPGSRGSPAGPGRLGCPPAWSPGRGPAAVAVTPKDSSALWVLAGRNEVKVPVRIAAYPALLQAGQLSGGQGLGGHWQPSLIHSSQDGPLPRMHMREAWDSEVRPLEG